MFRSELVNRNDPRLAAVGARPGMRLGRAVLAYQGGREANPESFDDAVDMLCGLAILHGLAHLVLEEKAALFFKKQNPVSSSKTICRESSSGYIQNTGSRQGIVEPEP